jgi:hypothetical protein
MVIRAVWVLKASAPLSRRRFLEAVTKTKLANILMFWYPNLIASYFKRVHALTALKKI